MDKDNEIATTEEEQDKVLAEAKEKPKVELKAILDYEDKGHTSIALKLSDEKMLVDFTGASGTAMADMLILQFISLDLGVSGQKAVDYTNGALEMYQGMEPKDNIECLLVSQIVVTHNMAMEFSKRAVKNGQTSEGMTLNVNRSTKLMRTFISQVEALKKYRNSGKQVIQVQHVQVNEGGQAIVSNVNGGGVDG